MPIRMDIIGEKKNPTVPTRDALSTVIPWEEFIIIY